MTGSVFLSILMVAALALAIGGTRLLMAGATIGKGALMLLCAAVLLGNVLVWTL